MQHLVKFSLKVNNKVIFTNVQNIISFSCHLWQKQRLCYSVGLLDNDKLPHFYYRDDAVKIWGAIQGFATEIVAVHYRDDEDVQLDEELLLFLQVGDNYPKQNITGI